MSDGWVRPLILTLLRDSGPMRFRDLRAALPPADPSHRSFYPDRLLRHLRGLLEDGHVARVNHPGPRPLWVYVHGAPDDESVL